MSGLVHPHTAATAHNETIVSQDKIIDINDWLTGVPGGIRRVRGSVNDAAMANPTQPIMHRILPVLDYFDMRKESRTGVGRGTQGLDSDVLKQSTADAYDKALKRSGDMIESIARVFAETGIKDLFIGMHELLIKHQDKERAIRLRGQWVQFSPLEWQYRENATVSVGLGHNSQNEQVGQMMMIAELQERASVAGIVSPENAFNLAEDLVQASGVKKHRARYFTHPQDMPPPQPAPNPLAEAETIKAQGRIQSEMMKYAQENKQEFVKLLMEDDHFRKQLAFDIAELEVTMGVDIAREGIAAELKREEISARPTGTSR